MLRQLPDFFAPGVAITVRLDAMPDAGGGGYAVEDAPPAGWSVSAISHGGSFDAANGRVKWGPFLDASPVARALSYSATPANGPSTTASFSGSGRFAGISVAVGGASSLSRFPGRLERVLPGSYRPGVAFTARLRVQPATNAVAYAVEEALPAGWTASALSHGGQFDAETRRLKWGPYVDGDAVARELICQLTPPVDDPSNEPGAVAFLGQGVFDGATVATAGPSLLEAEPSTVTSATPVTYLPEVAMTVALNVAPASFVRVWSLVQPIPAGWTVGTPSHGGTFDAASGSVKWGPFTEFPPVARNLTCRVTPPTRADGEFELAGQARFGRRSQAWNLALRRFRLHEASAIRRELPEVLTPGQPVQVRLVVTPRSGGDAIAVEDRIPSGWSVVGGSITGGGAFDAANEKLKWGPFLAPDNEPRTLSYQVVPPGPVVGTFAFSGSGWFPDGVLAMAGPGSITAPAGRITRQLPRRFTAGVECEGSLDVLPGAVASAHAVEEDVPPGWSFVRASEGGAFDATTRRIKWGPFADGVRRTLTYALLPPPTGAAPSNSFSGGGAFDRAFIDAGGASGVARNLRPVVTAHSVNRPPGQAFKISPLRLLADDTDPDGDLLSVVAVEPVSPGGAQVTLLWPWIYYVPPPSFDGPDEVRYSVSDGFGGVTSGTVQVVVVAPANSRQNILRVRTLPDGSRQVVFGGVPGYTYRIQASVDLDVWTLLGSRTADAKGQFEWSDSDAATFPTRFYRSAWP